MSDKVIVIDEHRPHAEARCAAYHDVRYPDDSLAFRIDPARMIVEIQRRGKKYYFDLATMLVEGVDKNNLLR